MDLTKSAIWVGYTDSETEGQWTLLNGEAYDAGDINQESLYYWSTGQPNNYGGNENCAHIRFINNSVNLNDQFCGTIYNNPYVWWKSYGLCEICQI